MVLLKKGDLVPKPPGTMRASKSVAFSRVCFGLTVGKRFELEGFVDGVISIMVTWSMASEIKAKSKEVIRDKADRVISGLKTSVYQFGGCEEKDAP